MRAHFLRQTSWLPAAIALAFASPILIADDKDTGERDAQAERVAKQLSEVLAGGIPAQPQRVEQPRATRVIRIPAGGERSVIEAGRRYPRRDRDRYPSHPYAPYGWAPRVLRDHSHAYHGGRFWSPGYARHYGLHPLGPSGAREFYRSLRQGYDRNFTYREENRSDMLDRKARLLTQAEKVTRAGRELLRQGDYHGATAQLLLASRLNHGDAYCRILLAQAQMARGQFEAAGESLHRGLELQPKLVYVDLRLLENYAVEGELDTHLAALRELIRTQAVPPKVLMLQGFFELQRGEVDDAYVAFHRAKRGLPRDERIAQFLELTSPGDAATAAGARSASSKKRRLGD